MLIIFIKAENIINLTSWAKCTLHSNLIIIIELRNKLKNCLVFLKYAKTILVDQLIIGPN